MSSDALDALEHSFMPVRRPDLMEHRKLQAELDLARKDLDAVLRWSLPMVNVSRQSCGHSLLDVEGLRALILGAAPHRA